MVTIDVLRMVRYAQSWRKSIVSTSGGFIFVGTYLIRSIYLRHIRLSSLRIRHTRTRRRAVERTDRLRSFVSSLATRIPTPRDVRLAAAYSSSPEADNNHHHNNNNNDDGTVNETVNNYSNNNNNNNNNSGDGTPKTHESLVRCSLTYIRSR